MGYPDQACRRGQDFGEIRDVLLMCRPRMLDAFDVQVIFSVQEDKFAHWAVPQSPSCALTTCRIFFLMLLFFLLFSFVLYQFVCFGGDQHLVLAVLGFLNQQLKREATMGWSSYCPCFLSYVICQSSHTFKFLGISNYRYYSCSAIRLVSLLPLFLSIIIVIMIIVVVTVIVIFAIIVITTPMTPRSPSPSSLLQHPYYHDSCCRFCLPLANQGVAATSERILDQK